MAPRSHRLLLVMALFAAAASMADACDAGYGYHWFWNCYSCRPGSYKDKAGRTLCTSCETGKYENRYASILCRDCPVGTYQPSKGQTSCDKCAPGFYADTTGLSSCLSCSAGSYSATDGAEQCTPCAVGSYQEAIEQASCEACGKGKHADQQGLSSCKLCQAGKYTDTLGQATCKPCAKGSYADSDATINCKPCSAGTVGATLGLTSCPACLAGTYQPSVGQEACIECSVGYFSLGSGNTQCDACPVGRFQPQSGQSTCLLCLAGTFQDVSGRSECKACGLDTYQPEPGKDHCLQKTTCPAGWAVDVSATSTSDRTCVKCTAGTYSPTPNTDACIDCPPGFTSTEDGATSCAAVDSLLTCEAGTYLDSEAVECVSCPAETFSSSTNLPACTAWTTCPDGTRVVQTPSATRDRTCTDCLAGSAAVGPNAPACRVCDPVQGQYQNVPLQKTCKNVTTCPAGAYIFTAATPTSDAECRACPAGTFSTTANVPECTAATDCVPGQFITAPLSSTVDRLCGACTVGVDFSTVTNALTCTSVSTCAIGEGATTQPTANSDRQCEACTAGVSFSETRDGTPCRLVSECGAGEEQAQEPTAARDRVCRTCSSGYFKPDAGSVAVCMAGTLCDNVETEVVALTPTSDRVCEPVQRCEAGVNIDTASMDSCSCPGAAACDSCLVQANRDGYFLERRDAIPKSTPVDSSKECEQLPLNGANPDNLDLVTPCHDRCSATATCAAFFVFTRGAAAGLCCLKSSFQDRDYSEAVGGEFYSMVVCSSCAAGFLREGLGCVPRAEPPVFDTPPPARVTAPLSLAVGSLLADLDASSRGGFDPVRYALLAVSGASLASAFHVNATTGALVLAAPFLVPGPRTLTLEVRDNRTSCTSLVDGAVITLDGGCRLTVEVVVDVAAFISCPESFVHYLPPTATVAALSWTVPTLASAFSAVTVSVNLPGGGAPPFTLPVGTTDVVYSTTLLDVGEALTCRFRARVVNGFALQATTIGHLAGTNTTFDFIIDDEEISGGGLTLPRFQGTVVGRTFALGVQAPKDKPFSLNVLLPYAARILVDVTWCASGTLDPTSADFVSAPASVTLAGMASLGFDDSGSGALSDGRCFRILAVSSPLTGQHTFSALDIALNLSSIDPAADIRRRRRSADDLDYFPTLGSVAGAQYRAVDAGTLPLGPGAADPGPMLVLEDLTPPQWFGCPLSAVRATAAAGATSVVATWDEPTATDNVGVVDQSQTHASGDAFSVVDSPHRVVYTARDASGLTAQCAFDVAVDFVASTQVVQADTEVRFAPRVRSIPLLGVTEVAYDLVTPFSAGLSFNTDLTNLTRLTIRIAAPSGDRMLVRTSPGASSIQFNADFRWTIDAPTSTLPLADDDVQVKLGFEGFALDTTPGADVWGDDSIAVEQTLVAAKAALDPAGGYIVLDGKSPPFRRGFSFTAVVLTFNFPQGRASSTVARPLPEGYFPTQDSTLSFGFYYDAKSTPTLSSLTAEPRLILLDVIPPSLQYCPPDMEVTVAPSAGGANVSWAPAIFTDNRPGLQLASSADPGEFFALLSPSASATRVRYTARDSFGNEATCVFAVRVVDTTAPTVVCPLRSRLVLAPGAREAVLTTSAWQPPTLTDNSPFPPTIIAPSGDLTLGVDVHSYTVIAEDVYGNRASCVGVVEVVDEEAPVLVCPNVNPVLGAGDGSGAEVRWTLLPPNDNDAIATVNLTRASGSRFPPGRTAVDVRVEDRSGNAANCTFIVEVQSAQAAASDSAASTSMLAGAGGGAALLLLMLLVMGVLLRRARTRARTPQDWDDIFKLIDQLKGRSEEDGIRVPREIVRGSIELLDELGRGAFGLVYKGLMREVPSMPGFLIAVKSLHPSAGGSDRQELLEEAAIMAQFSHKNVVQLVGVVTVGKPLLVVLEFMEHGSLKAYLEKNDVDEKTRTLFAGDVAAGLDHVHTKGFVHRDVAARNVLVDSSRRCKVADFGLARDTSDDTYYRSRGGQLPVRWSAPEALEDRKFNEKTDVWAFGICAYEIWTRAATPYDGWHNQKVWVEVSAGYRLPQPARCDANVYAKLLNCWDATSRARPTFAELVRFFRDRYAAMNDGVALDAEYLSVGTDDDDGYELPVKNNLMRRTVSQLMKRLSMSSTPRAATNPGYRASLPPSNGLVSGGRGGELYDLGEEKPVATNGLVSGGRGGELYDVGAETPAANANTELYDMGNMVGGEAGKATNSTTGGGDEPALRTGRSATAWPVETFGFDEEPEVLGSSEAEANPPLSVSESLLDMMASVEANGSTPTAPHSQSLSTSTTLGGVASPLDQPQGQLQGQAELYGNVDTENTDHMKDVPAKETLLGQEHIGRRVTVQGYTCCGVLRYLGPHMTKPGLRCGVELDEPIGLNDGTVGGHCYFTCSQPSTAAGGKRGVLVIPSKVGLVPAGTAV